MFNIGFMLSIFFFKKCILLLCAILEEAETGQNQSNSKVDEIKKAGLTHDINQDQNKSFAG